MGMLNTETRDEYAPLPRRARRDEVPNRTSVSPADRADANGVVLFDSEAPAPLRQDRVVPGGMPSIQHGDRSTIGAYAQELRGHPPMTRETEHDVAVRFRATADPHLAARLITANLRLVIKIAKEYQRVHTQLADLVQEGNVGLVYAVRKFDPSRGVKLASYASWWIRSFILNFVMSNYRLVRLGTTQAQRKLFFNLRKEREKLERRGFEVQPRQLAAALDVSEQEVVEMQQRLDEGDTSLDAPSWGEPNGTTRDVVAAPESRPDVNVETSEFKAVLVGKLNAFGATLRGRELDIFRDRLLSEEPVQLLQLAGRFGVSRERVRQLETRLKQRIRNHLEDEIGDIDDFDHFDVVQ
jgi:RNA polymerase sigma-32 factor